MAPLPPSPSFAALGSLLLGSLLRFCLPWSFGSFLVLCPPFRPGPPWVFGSLAVALRLPCLPAPAPRGWLSRPCLPLVLWVRFGPLVPLSVLSRWLCGGPASPLLLPAAGFRP